MLAPDDKYKGKKVRDYLVAMKAAGVQPVMVILERTSDRLREYVWIDYFRGQGVMLTNSAGNRGVRQIAGLPPRPRTIRAASGFLGVSQKGSKWRWGVMVKGVHQRGTCNTAIEAALARDAAVVALRGIGEPRMPASACLERASIRAPLKALPRARSRKSGARSRSVRRTESQNSNEPDAARGKPSAATPSPFLALQT